MEKENGNPSRRAMLGAAITIPAIVALGGVAAVATAKASERATVDRAAWERALDKFRQADTAMNAYLRDHLTPVSDAYQAVREKWPMSYNFANDPAARAEIDRASETYDPVQDHFDDLVCEQHDACELLMLIPAPDGAALVAKVDVLLAHKVYEWGGSAEIMAAIQGDTRRLLSSGSI